MSSNERHTHHIKAYTRILQFVISIEKKIGCRIVGSYARIDNSDICITKKFKFKDKVKLTRLLWTGYLIRVREKALPPLISWRVPKQQTTQSNKLDDTVTKPSHLSIASDSYWAHTVAPLVMSIKNSGTMNNPKKKRKLIPKEFTYRFLWQPSAGKNIMNIQDIHLVRRQHRSQSKSVELNLRWSIKPGKCLPNQHQQLIYQILPPLLRSDQREFFLNQLVIQVGAGLR